LTPEDLAKAVMSLKEGSKLARTVGENGRKYVESEAPVEAAGLKNERDFQDSDAKGLAR
jgi:hypothetical protein